MILLTLLIIPVIVAIATFMIGKHKVTLKEFLAQMGAQVLIAGICVGVMYYSNTHDVEVYNGQIIKKARVEVTCSHTYCCAYGQCCSGSGKTRSCTTCCKMTCKRHSYDVDWRVYTDIAEQFNINRLSSRGMEQPPRWTAVKIGEPYASTHSFTNYIKASPDSLFRNDGAVEQYKTKLPKYPQKIYDYHRLDRMVTVGLKIPNLKEWNTKLSEINSKLGPKVEANVITVIVKNLPREYFYALKQHWLGGKKNDVITVIGVDDNNKINWAEVMAWSKDAMFEVVLRDNLEAGELEVNRIMNHIQKDALQYFKRKPMSEYEYLKSAITPSTTQWIVSMLIGLISSVVIAWFMYNNNVQDYRRRY